MALMTWEVWPTSGLVEDFDFNIGLNFCGGKRDTPDFAPKIGLALVLPSFSCKLWFSRSLLVYDCCFEIYDILLGSLAGWPGFLSRL